MKKTIAKNVAITIIILAMTAGISSAGQIKPSRTTRLEKIILKMQQRRAALQAKKISTPKPTSTIPTPSTITPPSPIVPIVTPAPAPTATPTLAPTPTSNTPPTTPIPTTTPTATPETPPPALPATPTPPTPAPAATPAPPAPTITQLKNGLYVWNVTELLDTPDAWITKLQTIDIGGGQKINEIYLSAYHGTYAGLATKYQAAITKLHAANMQVYMLVGNYDWAIPATWNWINTNYVPLAANFDGVMLDVEPWATSDSATKTWWTSSQAPQDFANFINNWKTALGTKKLTLSIANWHDTATPSQMELLTKIYTSNADWITIMDYSTSSYISRIAYETTLSKPTAVAFDINKAVTPDPTIIFYTLADLKNAVTTTLQTYPTIRGFAINDQTLLTTN